MDSFRERSGFLFDSIASWIVVGVAFLLPTFFYPSVAAPFQFTKTLIVILGALAAFVFFVLARLKEGGTVIPRSWLLLSIWLLPLTYLLSSLLSGSDLSFSLTGRQYEVDTFAFVLIIALFTTLVALLFREASSVLRLYTALLAAFLVVALFQIIRLMGGPDVLTFGLFPDVTGNMVGKWNDLGIFAGVIAILSLVSIHQLNLQGYSKIALYAVLALSLFFLALVNFFPVWLVLGVLALGFFMSGIMSGFLMGKGAEGPHMTMRGMSKVSVAPLIVLAVSLIFMFGGDGLGTALGNTFGISQFEARPSWQTTIDIGAKTLSKNPLFGSGPNTFVEQWLQFKLTDINLTPFWNVDFIAGIGLIPTSFVTTGLLGGLAWIVFLGLFLYAGFRVLLGMQTEDSVAYFVTLSSFLSASYLWLLSILYVPNVVMLSLAFLFTGVFIASLRRFPTLVPDTHISFVRSPRVGFAVVFTFTLLLLASFGGIYLVGERYISSVYFQKAVIALNQSGDFALAETNVARALTFSELDTYHALLASINLSRMREVAARTEGDPETIRQEFQTYLANAVQYAQEATRTSPKSYQNWVVLGRVYSSVVPLNIEGAYENAKNAYDRASQLSPLDPSIQLALAELEIARNNLADADVAVKKAIALKPNYLDAIFLSAQLAIQAGKTAEAITAVEAATVFEPNNPVILYQLGLLYFGTNRVDDAIPAFERAVSISRDYANARYFLGLAYFEKGNRDASLQQFEEVQKLNPQNEEVATIIDNLRNGRDPIPQTVENPVVESEGQPVEERI